MARKPSRSAALYCTIDFSAFGMAMLLVIFMLLTIEMVCSGPHGQRGVGYDLPRAYHASTMERASREDAMVITIVRDWKVFFGSDPVEPGALPGLIRDQLGIGTEQKVYLRVDARARYDVVSRVLAEISAANIYKVAFLVEQKHAQRPAPPPPL
jgi:biopolymer transport protein ExbD